MAATPVTSPPTLWGQTDTYILLESVCKDPVHLFISGGPGVGKTTLARDFLSMFYTYHSKTQRKMSDSILYLSSEKDRGIHTIREKVNDFCKRSPTYPGQIRWIVFDDADSLPLISQQALRRPMETYAHLTKFIFISRQQSHLISPLRSRCYSIELDPITMFDVYDNIFLRYGLSEEKLHIVQHETIKTWFLKHTPAIHKAIPFVKLLIVNIKEGKTLDELLCMLNSLLFTSEPLSVEFIQSLVKKDTEKCIHILSNYFYDGFLLDDILLSLEKSLIQFVNLSGERRFIILKFIMRGWISIQQGKEYWLDTLDILFDTIGTGSPTAPSAAPSAAAQGEKPTA